MDIIRKTIINANSLLTIDNMGHCLSIDTVRKGGELVLKEFFNLGTVDKIFHSLSAPTACRNPEPNSEDVSDYLRCQMRVGNRPTYTIVLFCFVIIFILGAILISLLAKKIKIMLSKYKQNQIVTNSIIQQNLQMVNSQIEAKRTRRNNKSAHETAIDLGCIDDN